MGIRINAAIGWGMRFDDFVNHIRLPDDGQPRKDGWFDRLEEILDHTRSMRGPLGMPLPVTGPNNTVVDLIQLVGYDDKSDVILMPDIDRAKRWYRRDDDIDHALRWGPRAPTDHSVPNDHVDYLDYGFYPYQDIRMDTAGNDVPPPPRDDYNAYRTWETDRSLLPGVPDMIRHWTTTSGLLDQAGIALLRPVRATWWS